MRAMPQDDTAPVTRLYERLTEALQRTRRDPFNVPVTVAEIYQELVPYRLVRTEIGFDMNADYEHALLRLLAGEGEWLRIEPAHAADEIRRELRSSNPNLGVYREYAACDVWVRKPASAAEARRGERSSAASPVAVQPRPASRPPEPVIPRPPASRTAAEQKPAPEPVIPRPPASRTTAEQKPAPASPTPSAARKTAESPPAAGRTQKASPGTEPPPVRQKAEERGPEPAADWQVPVELKDIAVTGETPGAAVFEAFTLAGADRPDDREGEDDERAVAVTPMSDAPKREAASAGEGAGAPPSSKPARSGSSPRPAAPAPAAGSPGRGTPPTAASRTGAQAARAEAARCAFCDSALPQQRQARFCPYCGADQTTRPCAACGEPVEPGWAFCITCGATAQ